MKWGILLSLLSVAADACDFEKLAKMDPELAQAVQALHAPDLREAIRTASIPDWRVVQAAEDARVQVHAAVKAATEQGKMPEIEAAFSESPARDKPKAGTAGPIRYQPTEYDLRRDIQKNLVSGNRQLPPALRVPVPRLPRDARRQTLAPQGRRIIENQVVLLAPLYPTTGFETPEAYRDAVRAKGGVLEEIYDALDQETIRIAIRRPENGRWWIPRTGFHNQFVTGSSNGLLNNDRRNSTESNYTQIALPEYTALDAQLKPQYVTLLPPVGKNWAHDNSASQYGNDIYIVRPEAVRDRMTFTVGDSLNRHYYAGWVEQTPQSWDHLMVPWEQRTLLAPFLTPSVARGEFRMESLRDDTLPGFKVGWENGSSYPEAQIFGGLHLSDISELHFTHSPPTGEYLKALKRHGIRIYDARQSPPAPWEGK